MCKWCAMFKQRNINFRFTLNFDSPQQTKCSNSSNSNPGYWKNDSFQIRIIILLKLTVHVTPHRTFFGGQFDCPSHADFFSSTEIDNQTNQVHSFHHHPYQPWVSVNWNDNPVPSRAVSSCKFWIVSSSSSSSSLLIIPRCLRGLSFRWYRKEPVWWQQGTSVGVVVASCILIARMLTETALKWEIPCTQFVCVLDDSDPLPTHRRWCSTIGQMETNSNSIELKIWFLSTLCSACWCSHSHSRNNILELIPYEELRGLA